MLHFFYYYTYTKLETRKTQEGDTLYRLTDENEVDFDLCFINYSKLIPYHLL